MTNLKKFQEVFGITIDDRFLRPAGCQCRFLDFIDSSTSNKCEDIAACYDCPLFKFWNREYAEKPKPTAGNYIEDFWW